MLKEIILPKQGLQMTEGTITKWIIPEGGDVKEGEPLFEMETDKLTITIDATASGKLLKIVRGEGETVPITEIIAYVGDEADRASIPADAAKAAPAVSAETKPAAPAPAPATPAVPAKAEPAKEDAKEAPKQEKEAKKDKKAPKTAFKAATPRAKTFADMYNINLAKVAPTGPDGLVIARDVIGYADTHSAQTAVSYAIIKVKTDALNKYSEMLSKDDGSFEKETLIAKIAEKAFAKTETFDEPSAEDICVKCFTSLLVSVNAAGDLPSISFGAEDDNSVAPVTFVYEGEDEEADKFLGTFKRFIENPVFAFIM